MDEATERNLVSRAKIGDWPAFDALMEEHQERVYRLACRLTDGHEEADAVTQDVFVQAYKALRKFRGGSRLMTWLYSIAVHQVQDRQRRIQRRPETLSLAERSHLSVDRRRTSPAGPLERLEQKELKGVVSEAVTRLPFEQQAALSLVAQEGLSYRDAAAVLQCSVGTVAWRMWDARRRMRDLLASYLE